MPKKRPFPAAESTWAGQSDSPEQTGREEGKWLEAEYCCVYVQIECTIVQQMVKQWSSWEK